MDGPALITNAIRSNTAISSELTLLNQQGSNVELGEVAVVPIDQTLLYVQPVYVESSANQIPTLKDVVVVYNSTAYQSNNASVDNALCQILNPDGSKPFSTYCNTPEAQAAPLVGSGAAGSSGSSSASGSTRPNGSTTTTPTTTPAATPTTTPTAAPPPAGATVQSLLADAKASFAAAQTALKSGNLAGYQTDIQQGITYVNQAQTLAGQTKP